jgi:hypothetical protein
MKQLIYYIKLTNGTELISITRADAIEKINAQFKNEQYYEPIKISTLDRLILNRQSNSYIEIATKTPINEYYKKQVDLFILNDKKQRTPDAMKKAINRYVNKLYYSNHIVENDVKTKSDIITESEYPFIETESQNQVISDEIETNEIIKEDLNPLDISNSEIKTINIVETEIDATDSQKPEVEEQINIDNNDQDILNNDAIVVVKSEIDTIDVVEAEEEINNDILKQLADYLINNSQAETSIDMNDIKNYYDNNREEVEELFINNNMGLLMNDEPIKKHKNRRIKQKIKTLRRKLKNHRTTIKK